MKVRQAYERALALINERDSGGAYHSDVTDFEKNTPELVNSIITLLWLDECILRNISVKKIEWNFEPVKTMDDDIPLHDALSSGALPFALASLLILEEDAQRADYFWRIYNNARAEIVKTFASAWHSTVKDVY